MIGNSIKGGFNVYVAVLLCNMKYHLSSQRTIGKYHLYTLFFYIYKIRVLVYGPRLDILIFWPMLG